MGRAGENGRGVGGRSNGLNGEDGIHLRIRDPICEIGRAVVIADASGIHRRGVAVPEHDPRHAMIFGSTELPAAATAVPGRIASRSILDQRGAKVPHRPVGWIQRADNNWIGSRSLTGQINAEGIGARRNHHFVSGLGRFDLRVVVARTDVDHGPRR